MPMIRITQKGSETFTGLMGDIEFENGVTVHVIGRADARRLGGILSVVEVDEEGESTGVNPSGAQEIIDDRTLTADGLQKLRVKQMKYDAEFESNMADKAVDTAIEAAEKAAKEADSDTPGFNFTAEDLEAIADEKGMPGMRLFADKYDVKGTSIAGLMKQLLALKAVAATQSGDSDA